MKSLMMIASIVVAAELELDSSGIAMLLLYGFPLSLHHYFLQFVINKPNGSVICGLQTFSLILQSKCINFFLIGLICSELSLLIKLHYSLHKEDM